MAEHIVERMDEGRKNTEGIFKQNFGETTVGDDAGVAERKTRFPVRFLYFFFI